MGARADDGEGGDVDKAYEVDASSMCEALRGVVGVEDVTLEFDLRGNGVLRISLLEDADEDTVVGVAVARLRRRYGVGLEGGRLRLTGPSGRPVVAVVQGPRRPGTALAAALDAHAPLSSPSPVGAAPGVVAPGVAAPPDGHGAGVLGTGAATDRSSSTAVSAGATDSSTWYPGLAEPQNASSMPVLPRTHRAAFARPGALNEVVHGDPISAEVTDGPPVVAGEAVGASADLRSGARLAGDDPAPSPQGRHREQRLVLERVDVASGRIEMWATVHLRCGDEVHTGTAGATATGSGMHRAVVAATARAAESALGGRVRLDVEAVDLLGVGSDQVGVVVLTLLAGAGVDRLSGAALVRGDGPSALVRATLDAVNRRTERLDLEHPAPRS